LLQLHGPLPLPRVVAAEVLSRVMVLSVPQVLTVGVMSLSEPQVLAVVLL
jgi:hypothetical protein